MLEPKSMESDTLTPNCETVEKGVPSTDTFSNQLADLVSRFESCQAISEERFEPHRWSPPQSPATAILRQATWLDNPQLRWRSVPWLRVASSNEARGSAKEPPGAGLTTCMAIASTRSYGFRYSTPSDAAQVEGRQCVCKRVPAALWRI
jgi:hypothetical protein